MVTLHPFPALSLLPEAFQGIVQYRDPGNKPLHITAQLCAEKYRAAEKAWYELMLCVPFVQLEIEAKRAQQKQLNTKARATSNFDPVEFKQAAREIMEVVNAKGS